MDEDQIPDSQMEGSPYGMEGMDEDMMGDPMDGYGDEGQEGYDPMDGGQYGDEGQEYGQEQDEDEEIDFSADPQFQGMPPLDKMRKVRREILRTINDIREKFGNPCVYPDFLTNKAANEYAEYLLQHDEENKDVQKECLDKHHVVGEVQTLQGIAYLEEDVVSKDPTKKDEFMDAHGLLLELQYELGQLTDKQYTHVGIGFAANTQKVKVVEMLIVKPIMVNHLGQTEDGSVEVRGAVKDPKEVGIYAARIVAQSNMKKEIAVVGPAAIDYNKGSGEFVITLKTQGIDGLFFNVDDPRYLELYIQKRQVDKIKYGADADPNERVNVAHLEISMRVPMDYYPDPRTVIEDDADRQRYERDMAERQKRLEEERLIMVAANLARKEERAKKREEMLAAKMAQDEDGDGDDMSGSDRGSRHGTGSAHTPQGTSSKQRSGSQAESGSQDNSEYQDDDELGEDQQEDEDYDGGVGDLPSAPEMQAELIRAILDERDEYETLKRQNDDLQRQIFMRDNSARDTERQSEQMLNEHKYLNTLANVHQVRFNLKETQDRYNKMASELQAKLNEKQSKCQEIEAQFKALKNSVAKNAVFSRTGKKLKESMIEQWEVHEGLKDQEVHQYRLQNISLRNRHDNLDKIYKKKEQLADGLHLIDFEQLKIENQTLNEKIEERNEELHKLRKKITDTVVKLSHTREKYQYIKRQNEHKNKELVKLQEELTSIKTQLSKQKRLRESYAKLFQKLKQQTGIVSQQSLKVDFQDRGIKIEQLEAEIEELSSRHDHIQRKIDQARPYQTRGY